MLYLFFRQYNFHPGATAGLCTESQCLNRIAESLNWVHEQTANFEVKVITVIENMAGQGSTMGATWEQIKTIIDQVKDKSRVGYV